MNDSTVENAFGINRDRIIKSDRQQYSNKK